MANRRHQLTVSEIQCHDTLHQNFQQFPFSKNVMLPKKIWLPSFHACADRSLLFLYKWAGQGHTLVWPAEVKVLKRPSTDIDFFLWEYVPISQKRSTLLSLTVFFIDFSDLFYKNIGDQVFAHKQRFDGLANIPFDVLASLGFSSINFRFALCPLPFDELYGLL